MKKLIYNLLFLFFTIFAAGQATAVPTLTMNASNRISAGSNFSVSVGISGLDPSVQLGAFSFDFYFTPSNGASFLPFNTFFGNQLGNPNDLLETVVGLTGPTTVGNSQMIQAFEVSLLPNLSFQANSFTLITFGLYAPFFNSIANQTLSVFANNFVLSDALGNQIFASNTQVGQLITVVPEPPSLLLISLGLLGLAFSIKQENKVSETSKTGELRPYN